MRVEIVNFGKNKEIDLVKAEKEYLKRLQTFMKVSLYEAKPGKGSSEDQIKAEEERTFFSRTKESGKTILLDENGKLFTSLEHDMATFTSLIKMVKRWN